MDLTDRPRNDRDALRLPSRQLDRARLIDEQNLLQSRFLQFDALSGYLRLQEERFSQLNALLGYFRLQGMLTAVVIAEATRRFKSFKKYEINFIAANFNQIITDPALLNALIMGGDAIVSANGDVGQVYPVQRPIGIGGMAAVYEAYFSDGAALEAAVVKQFIPNSPSSDAPEAVAEHVLDEVDRRHSHRMEAFNIKRFFPRPRPGFVRPLFVGRRRQDEEELVVYEKVVSLNGRSYDLADISAKRLLPPSAILRAFTHAVFNLEGLHEDGVVHGDLTLLNMFLNQRGEGVIGDLSTLFSLKDPVRFQRNTSDGIGYLLSKVDLGSDTLEFDIPHNRTYFDADLIERALQSGNSLKVVDYLALGTGILLILENLGLLVRASNSWDYAPWFQDRMASGYPLPSALVDLVALAHQLRAIDRRDLSVSLVVVSKILHNIVAGFQESIDPLYRK